MMSEPTSAVASQVRHASFQAGSSRSGPYRQQLGSAETPARHRPSDLNRWDEAKRTMSSLMRSDAGAPMIYCEGKDKAKTRVSMTNDEAIEHSTDAPSDIPTTIDPSDLWYRECWYSRTLAWVEMSGGNVTGFYEQMLDGRCKCPQKSSARVRRLDGLRERFTGTMANAFDVDDKLDATFQPRRPVLGTTSSLKRSWDDSSSQQPRSEQEWLLSTVMETWAVWEDDISNSDITAAELPQNSPDDEHVAKRRRLLQSEDVDEGKALVLSPKSTRRAGVVDSHSSPGTHGWHAEATRQPARVASSESDNSDSDNFFSDDEYPQPTSSCATTPPSSPPKTNFHNHAESSGAELGRVSESSIAATCHNNESILRPLPIGICRNCGDDTTSFGKSTMDQILAHREVCRARRRSLQRR